MRFRGHGFTAGSAAVAVAFEDLSADGLPSRVVYIAHPISFTWGIPIEAADNLHMAFVRAVGFSGMGGQFLENLATFFAGILNARFPRTTSDTGFGLPTVCASGGAKTMIVFGVKYFTTIPADSILAQ